MELKINQSPLIVSFFSLLFFLHYAESVCVPRYNVLSASQAYYSDKASMGKTPNPLSWRQPLLDFQVPKPASAPSSGSPSSSDPSTKSSSSSSSSDQSPKSPSSSDPSTKSSSSSSSSDQSPKSPSSSSSSDQSSKSLSSSSSEPLPKSASLSIPSSSSSSSSSSSPPPPKSASPPPPKSASAPSPNSASPPPVPAPKQASPTPRKSASAPTPNSGSAPPTPKSSSGAASGPAQSPPKSSSPPPDTMPFMDSPDGNVFDTGMVGRGPGVLASRIKPFLEHQIYKVDTAVTRICKTTDFQDLCASSLAPFFKGKSDPYTMISAAIKASIQHTQLSIEAAAKIADSPSTNPITASNLRDCQDSYQDALENLQEATNSIANEDIGRINSMLAAVVTDASDCEDLFPGQSSPILDYQIKFRQLASNNLAIASLAM